MFVPKVNKTSLLVVIQIIVHIEFRSKERTHHLNKPWQCVQVELNVSCLAASETERHGTAETAKPHFVNSGASDDKRPISAGSLGKVAICKATELTSTPPTPVPQPLEPQPLVQDLGEHQWLFKSLTHL